MWENSHHTAGQHKRNQKQNLEELKLLIHDTHASDITIKQTPQSETPKLHNFNIVLTDRFHKAGGWLIRDNITNPTTDIPSTINKHTTELKMVEVQINNAKHITIANIYIPPRHSSSTHYKMTPFIFVLCMCFL